MMRTYGEISGVMYKRVGWNIYNLATEYRLFDGDMRKSVYVNSMAELKQEIRDFIAEVEPEGDAPHG